MGVPREHKVVAIRRTCGVTRGSWTKSTRAAPSLGELRHRLAQLGASVPPVEAEAGHLQFVDHHLVVHQPVDPPGRQPAPSWAATGRSWLPGLAMTVPGLGDEVEQPAVLLLEKGTTRSPVRTTTSQ